MEPKRPASPVVLATLTFGLVILSLLFLMGVGVGAFYLVAKFWASEDKRGGAAIAVAIFFFAVYLLKYPWNALFKFSGSEVRLHGMRKKSTNEMPDGGPDQNEG